LLRSILDAWYFQGDPGRQLPAQAIKPGWSVDNPPPIQRRAYEALITSLPADPLPLRRLLNILPGWSVDNPPPGQNPAVRRAIMDLWLSPVPIIQPRQFQIPLIIVPYLPPKQMQALTAVLDWWYQGDQNIQPPKVDMATLTSIMPVLRRIVTVSWGSRQGGVGFTTRQPGSSFITRAPGTDFEEE